MMPPEQTLAEIARSVEATLSPDAQTRRAAEATLTRLRGIPAFSVALLHLVENAAVPLHVRQAAAVYLKNHMARVYGDVNWKSTAPDDRAAIKATLVDAMLRAPLPVRRQLNQVLATIAEHEYPDDWQQLMPDLGGRLQALVTTRPIDWAATQAVLETLHSVFERYLWRERSDPLWSEIKFSLMYTQSQVLVTMQLLAELLRDPSAVQALGRETATVVVTNAELICRIFFCLSWQDLNEFFEDKLQLFMSEFKFFLSYENNALDDDSDSEPSCVDKLVVAVLEVLNLFESKFDEDFRPYVQAFVSDTWTLLTKRSNSTKNDGVVTNGIKFLTTVSRSPDFALFSDPATLNQVCQQIVLPNIELRDDDIELFEDNPVEYVRRDMEGSDIDTRRHGAVELVKGLCVHFEQPVTQAFSSYITEMVKPEATWKQKDAALFMVTALGWKEGTASGGVTRTSSMIDVLDFLRTHVLPNLTAFAATPTTLPTPIYTADLLKYVISFRNQIPKESYPDIVGLCVKLLGAQEPVVQTYSAACIERLLSVKDSTGPVANGNGHAALAGPQASGARVPRIDKQDIKPWLTTLLPATVQCLQTLNRADEYVMRLLLRIVTVAREEIAPFAEQTMQVSVQVLRSVIENPTNPLFNHFLFEILAALIRFAGSPSTIGGMEAALLERFQEVLEKDMPEFSAYVFQILSQMMAFHDSSFPPFYAAIVPPLLDPVMWERRGYIRGMVQYLETYVRKNSSAVVANQQLAPMLGVFNKLVASKATDHLGIQLLCTILQSFDAEVLRPMMREIMNVLMMRLQAAKTPKYVHNLLYCLSLIIIRFGVDELVNALNALQPGLLGMLLQQVWVKEVPSVMRPSDRRVCAIGLADLACTTDLCRTDPYAGLWGSMITAVLALTEGVQTQADGDVSDDEDDDAPVATAGELHSSGHSQLRWARTRPRGDAAQVPAHGVDAKKHLARRVAELAARHPGVYGGIIAQQVEQGAQQALGRYLAEAGVQVA